MITLHGERNIGDEYILTLPIENPPLFFDAIIVAYRNIENNDPALFGDMHEYLVLMSNGWIDWYPFYVLEAYASSR